MCKCTPEMKTPFCGKPGCEWPVKSIPDELLPCPFCGKKAKLKIDEDHHGTFYNLGCSDKNCLASDIFYTMDTEDVAVKKAISSWNTRYIDEEYWRDK